MSSTPHSYYQPNPPPPVRTSTVDSNNSRFSGPMSPGSDSALSPTLSSKSQVENGFFSAISQAVRRGRSRSRNRVEKSRSRSRSPMVLPPQHIPQQRAAPVMSPTQEAPRPQQARHVSTASQSSITSQNTRPGAGQHGTSRRSSDLWHGRQTNSWLFNDFSFTETAKEFINHGRKSS
jgi:hypothetical protein